MYIKDHLLRHSLLLMAASQVGNLSNMLFHMVMGRWLAPPEYGVLASMLGVVLMAGMPLTALSNSVAFLSAQMAQENRTRDIWRLVRTWALKLLLIAMPLLFIGILFSHPLAQFFKVPGQSTIILALAILGLSFFPPIIGGALQGIQAFGWASISGASWGVVRLIIGAALVYWITASAYWALVGQGMGVISSGGIALAGLWLALRMKMSTTGKIPSAQAYFLRTLVVLACFAFLMNADVLIVKHFFSPDQSGFFARAATIGRTIIFLPMPIAGALFPKTVSTSTMSAQHGRLLWRALLYTVLVIGPPALICSVFPQLPLGILYHDWHPGAAMCRLVRCAIWAMISLSPAFIIMNFELAQSRFRMTWPLLLCVAGYLAGVSIWHASVLQVVAVLAIVSVATLLVVVKGLPWSALGRTPASAAG